MNKTCLPKKMRLLTSDEFHFVFTQSKRTKANGLTVFSKPNQLKYPRIGLSISKKYIKYAHERNKIKRHIRETFRINQHKLSTTDFVFTINSKEIVHFKNHVLIKELKKLWNHHLC